MRGFQSPIAHRPLNSTTSLSSDINVPRKFLTILAKMVGRVGIEPTTNLLREVQAEWYINL
jgi:hypothetical protein